MDNELFENVANQLIGLLNVEINKRDAELDTARKTIRDLRADRNKAANTLWNVQRDLDLTRGEGNSTRREVSRLRGQQVVPVKVNEKQVKLDAVLELATERPAWAGEILRLQFPSIDIIGLLGSILALMESNKKIEAIKLLRALTPHTSEYPNDGAYIRLKSAKEFVESYGGDVNVNYLKENQK